MNNEMPDEIELGLFYAPAPMSEHFYSVIDAETKMTPVASAKYVRADKSVPEWQPIETAPKDWKRVLVTDGFEVCDAYFRGGEWWQYECGDDWYSVSINPTNWMPLPQPPTKGGE